MPIDAVSAGDILDFAPTDGISLGDKFRFNLKILRADLGNFFLHQYRHVDGFLITGKNSGTHWLKYMLSCAIAQEFGVAPPQFASGSAANEIIGHPAGTRPRNGLPRIGSAHTIPSVAFRWPWFNRISPRPPIVLLVRDIQSAMLSNYVKWKDSYNVPLSDYVRGDPSGKRFIADIWWYIHFFNRWGDIQQRLPEQLLVLRYEEMQRDPHTALAQAARHWGINLSPTAISAAMPYASREALRQKLDPAFSETVIPAPRAKAALKFSDSDRRFIRAAFEQHLRHDFGYAKA